MQIDIKASNFPLTNALRRHVEGRLRAALSFYDEHIQRVNVRLSDINGPRGGAPAGGRPGAGRRRAYRRSPHGCDVLCFCERSVARCWHLLKVNALR